MANASSWWRRFWEKWFPDAPQLKTRVSGLISTLLNKLKLK